MKRLVNLSLASALALASLSGVSLAQDNNNGGANSGAQSGQAGKSGAGDNNDPTSTSQNCRDAAATSGTNCQTDTTAQ